MDWLVENYNALLDWLVTIAGVLVAVAGVLRALKSESRLTNNVNTLITGVKEEMKSLDSKVAVTRAGIVQGFKDAVVTKDVKVSVNTQVKKILDEHKAEIMTALQKAETRRTMLTYWNLKILRYTAAYDKLTPEQQREIDEVMALIAEDETIVDTSNI